MKNFSIISSQSVRNSSSLPDAIAATSCDKSSTVGPSPPLTITASALSEARSKALSKSSLLSPTVVPQITFRPTSSHLALMNE